MKIRFVYVVCSLILSHGLPGEVQAQMKLLGLGNSQLNFCGGSLSVLASMAAGVQDGTQFVTTQQMGNARIQDYSAIDLANQLTENPQDYVLFTHQELGWDELTLEEIYTRAAVLHAMAIRKGAKPIFFMTYAMGVGDSARPSVEERRVEEFTGYWNVLKERLDALEIDGSTHEAIFLPVLPLWEEGKKAYPYRPATGNEDGCVVSGWMHDSAHGANMAHFATGALLYSYLTCKDPRDNPYQGNVPAEFAAWAKGKAWEYLQRDYTPQACGGSFDQDASGSNGAGAGASAGLDGQEDEGSRSTAAGSSCALTFDAKGSSGSCLLLFLSLSLGFLCRFKGAQTRLG